MNNWLRGSHLKTTGWFMALALGMMSLGFTNGASQGRGALAFNDLKRQGIYHLVQGTAGCAQELVWTALPRCNGFQLSASLNGKFLNAKKYRELFCHVNQGVGHEVHRSDPRTEWRIQYRVAAEDNMIRKNQKIERDLRGSLYRAELEASVILDQGSSFMFDRSLGGNGTSCLYRK